MPLCFPPLLSPSHCGAPINTPLPPPPPSPKTTRSQFWQLACDPAILTVSTRCCQIYYSASQILHRLPNQPQLRPALISCGPLDTLPTSYPLPTFAGPHANAYLLLTVHPPLGSHINTVNQTLLFPSPLVGTDASTFNTCQIQLCITVYLSALYCLMTSKGGLLYSLECCN